MNSITIYLSHRDAYTVMPTVRVKVWLEDDGETVMSEGRAALLAEIDLVGSLSTAAKNLHMSYKHARNLIDSLQGRGNEPIVIATRGGHSRGTAHRRRPGHQSRRYSAGAGSQSPGRALSLL